MRRAGALALALLALAAPAAAAVERTSADVRALALRAADGDARALAELRDTTAVDGQPADLAAALRDDGAVDERLALLARRDGATATAPDATDTARAVLGDDRYAEERPDQPLRGVFVWIGDQVDWVVRQVEHLVDDLDDVLPGGAPVPWTLLAAAALVLAVFVAARSARVLQVREATAARDAGGLDADAAALERAAARAEQDGDLAGAVRLRFAAGLWRLDERSVIELRPSLTVDDVRRRLRLPAFDALAVTFEDVAYGEKQATAADVAHAREGWPRVLQESRA